MTNALLHQLILLSVMELESLNDCHDDPLDIFMIKCLCAVVDELRSGA